MYHPERVVKLLDLFGPAALLSGVLLSMTPMTSCYIDCRISCRRCQENTEHPSVLEVYCAMCDECKQRRREKLLGRSGSFTALAASINAETLEHNDKVHVNTNKHIGSTPLTHEHSDESHQRRPRRIPAARGLSALSGIAAAPMIMSQPIVIPPACPMPSYCSETEEEVVLQHEESTTTTTTSTTTTTTSTPRPTRPSPQPLLLKKSKRKIPQYQPMMAAMPCMSCMQPMCPLPCQMAAPPVTYPPPLPATHNIVQLLSPTTRTDFDYVYIGVPKNVLKS